MFTIRFRERTRGELHFHDAPLKTCAVSVDFDFAFSLLPEALEKKTISLTGKIDIAGLASARPHEGSVLVHWGNEQRMRYEILFVGDDGDSYRLVGQKDFLVIAPIASLTTLSFTLYRGEYEELGDGVVSVDPKKWLFPTLRTLRFARGFP